MTAEASQDAVIAWLKSPVAYQAGAEEVECVVTHAAMVFLVGARAYKIKRAVRYPYLDFSTIAARKTALERELALNRRSAPDLYLRLVSINRGDDGALLPVGSTHGSPVEWALEMVRFDRTQELDRLAARGALSADLIDTLARSIAAFHKHCAVRRDMGGADEMSRLILQNMDELNETARFIGASRIAALGACSAQTLSKMRALLDERRDAGFVRHCHGDLHLGNIVCLKGVPILFDCIEFDDRLACIDALYDLAFLLMDLLHCDLLEPANRLLNGYLDAMPYEEFAPTLRGLALLPLFLSIRSVIRAHVEARQTGASIGEGGGRQIVEAYVTLAEDSLKSSPPRLIAVGGLSGSGKSTLARRLAPVVARPLGALILRTDVLRKRMLGISVTEHLDDSTYTSAASDKVYAEMMTQARYALEAGQTVIVDAVFSKERERDAVQALAGALGLPFHGFWLTAPYADLVTRLDRRRGDASDATRKVLDRQREYEIGRLAWPSIDTARGMEDALKSIRRQISASGN